MPNLPATAWQDPNQEIEPTVTGTNNIVDPAGNNLVDPSGNQIIDTGLSVTYTPGTAWEGNDIG